MESTGGRALHSLASPDQARLLRTVFMLYLSMSVLQCTWFKDPGIRYENLAPVSMLNIGLSSSKIIQGPSIHVYLFKMGPTKKNRDTDK
jgi:hypothetical protein